MIRSEEDVKRILQARMAPIYFFSVKAELSKSDIKHGTIFFYKNHNGTFGITNSHVYEDFEELEPPKILNIGNYKVADLKGREIYRSCRKEKDIMVFHFTEKELEKIGNKGCFTVLEDINVLSTKYPQQFNFEQDVPLHFAGFQDKLIKSNINKRIEIEFQIFFSAVPATVCEDNITLRFSDIRNAVKSGSLVSSVGNLTDQKIDFGGISGCPIFARTLTNRFDLSLLGIVYEGHGNTEGFLPEVIYARPISLIQDALIG